MYNPNSPSNWSWIEDDDLLEYIDFQGICEDYDLKHGDISPHQVQQLRIILAEFIRQNHSAI